MGEIAFENYCCDRMLEDGWANRKMMYPGRKGCPDRWFFRNGQVRIVEFKKPGGVLSLNQVREIRRLKKLGLDVWVISTVVEFEEMRNA